MKKFKSHLLLGCILVISTCIGFYLQKTEDSRYTLEIKTPDGFVEYSPNPEPEKTDVTSDAVSPEPETDENSFKININTATEAELVTLDGIGESRARDIIKYRTEKGNFKVIEDIMKISGIGEKLYDKIKNMITV